MSRRRCLSALVPVVLASLVSGAFAQATLVRTGGLIGGPLGYEMSGDPGEAYVLIPSPHPGPTPVSIWNPGDPRVLNVGINHPKLWTLGILDPSGAATRTYNLPPDPALQGLVAYAQFLTYTTGPVRVDDVSNPTSFVFGDAGTSHLTVGPMLRDASLPTATRLLDGRALIAGGSKTVAGSSVTTSDLELFDPQTQTFRATTSMAEARVLHTATVLQDGRVLLLGGSDDADVILATGELFDPATESVTPIAPMGVARAGHTATLLADGRVLVIGGTSQFDFSDPLAALAQVHRTSELYHPGTNSWSPGPDLPKPRVLAAATLLESTYVLLSGGIEVTTFILPIPDWSSDCRLYDPINNVFYAAAGFANPRAMHSQLRLSDGRVLLAGGTDGDLVNQVFTPRADCRVYTPGSGWVNAGTMANARALGTTLVERNGDVLVLGGMSTVDLTTLSGTAVTDVERAPLGSLSWSVAGSLLSPRPANASVALEGGERILTVGASVDGDRTAEIFLP